MAPDDDVPDEILVDAEPGIVDAPDKDVDDEEDDKDFCPSCQDEFLIEDLCDECGECKTCCVCDCDDDDDEEEDTQP